MSSHVSVPITSVSQVTGVENSKCLETMHILDMEKNWNQWELNVDPIRQVCKTHRFYK